MLLGSHQRWRHISSHRQRRVEELLRRRADAALLLIDREVPGLDNLTSLENSILEEVGPIDPLSRVLD